MQEEPEGTRSEWKLPQGALAVVLKVAEGRLALQMGQIGRLDSKPANIFGFASAIAALATAFIALRFEGLGTPEFVLLVLGLISYALLLAVSLAALFPRAWHYGPDPWDLWTRLGPHVKPANIQYLVAESLIDAVPYNQGKIDFKAASATVLIILLALEVVFLISATSLAAIG